MTPLAYIKARIEKPKTIKKIDSTMAELGDNSKRMSRLIANAKAIRTEAEVEGVIDLAKEIRFLSDDCITRLARCRQCLKENEFVAAGRFSEVAYGQAKEIEKKSKLLNVFTQNIRTRED